jgi:hypothetical protein
VVVDEEHEGLGGLPPNLMSVSSLLLFNTEENPYKRYAVVDPLRGAVTKTREGGCPRLAAGLRLAAGPRGPFVLAPTPVHPAVPFHPV